MSTILNHISVGLPNPQRAGEALCRMTGGTLVPFPPLKGAFACLWDGGWRGQFVELYPDDITMRSTDTIAEFVRFPPSDVVPRTTHINLSVDKTSKEIMSIAEEYGYRSLIRKGQPLVEVWFENVVLFEFQTTDL